MAYIYRSSYFWKCLHVNEASFIGIYALLLPLLGVTVVEDLFGFNLNAPTLIHIDYH